MRGTHRSTGTHGSTGSHGSTGHSGSADTHGSAGSLGPTGNGSLEAGFVFEVVRTEERHARQVADLIRLAHGAPLGNPSDNWMNPWDIVAQVRRFPEGQFVAVTRVAGEERVIGAAILMRTNYPPTGAPLTWERMLGDYGLSRHEPDGVWLYGVEMSVHPDFRRRGVASALYRARQELVGKLGLRGLYLAGMLKGYGRYQRTMTLQAYAQRVAAGEIRDPTVSMQLHRGFKAVQVVPNYTWDPAAGHSALLMQWQPTYQVRRSDPPRKRRFRRGPAAGRQPPYGLEARS